VPGDASLHFWYSGLRVWCPSVLDVPTSTDRCHIIYGGRVHRRLLCSTGQVWFRALLSDLDLQDPNKPTTLFIDNESARSLAHNPVHHARSKRIDVKFHWLREQVLAGILRVEHVNTHEQKADVLTKPKTGDAFHRNALELVTEMQSA
jgi:hypothetical protein